MEVKSGKAISANHNERTDALILAPLPSVVCLSLWGIMQTQQWQLHHVFFQGFTYHYRIMNGNYGAAFWHFVELLFWMDAVKVFYWSCSSKQMEIIMVIRMRMDEGWDLNGWSGAHIKNCVICIHLGKKLNHYSTWVGIWIYLFIFISLVLLLP